MSDTVEEGSTRSDFFPCLITVQRDPSVWGKTRLEYVVHSWNSDPRDHVREDLLRDASQFPIPLATVELMEDVLNDFYAVGEPRFCKTCFPEQYPDADNQEADQ